MRRKGRNLFRLCDSRTQYMINILHLIKVAAVVIVAAVSAGCERPVEITWDASSLHRVTGGVYARVKVLSDGRLALVYSAGPAVCMRTSVDGGDSWSEASEIARATNVTTTPIRSFWSCTAAGCCICGMRVRVRLESVNTRSWVPCRMTAAQRGGCRIYSAQDAVRVKVAGNLWHCSLMMVT